MKLPASIREIAEVIGHERALFLIGQLPQCYAGQPGKKSNRVILYVPIADRLRTDHQLVKILGWQDAQALCIAFGGEILQPANCSGIYREFRDSNIARIVAEGVPVAMVAEWFAVSERHIKNLIRENPQEEQHARNDNNPGK